MYTVAEKGKEKGNRMKVKKALVASIITMFIITMIPMLGVEVGASPLPYLVVMPQPKVTKIKPPTIVGDTFDITVNATNVVNYYGADFWLDYNSTLLNCTNVVFYGTGSVNEANPGAKLDKSVTYEVGRVKVSATFVYGEGATDFDGTGIVAWLTFEVMYTPPVGTAPPPYNVANCSLAFVDAWTCMYEIDYSTTPPTAGVMTTDPPVDGWYEIKTTNLVPGAPTASFTWSPMYPFECDTVTLTCTSTSGPPGSWIVSRKWVVTNGTGTAHLTGPDNVAQTTMHCDGAGTVFVNLTVINNFQIPDDQVETIEQKELVGCFLDLYTSNNRFCGQTTPYVGKGFNESCDALTNDVNVTLYANVTWNRAPRMHVLVAFEVWWVWKIDWQHQEIAPVFMNRCVLYRTAETDKYGIAKIWFRVPTPCPDLMHGKWLAIATAKVQEVKQNDTMHFDVGYLITIVRVWTTDDEGQPKDKFFAPCDNIGFVIEVKNIAWVYKYVKFIVVAYDDCDVPIGQVIVGIYAPPGRYCNPAHFFVYIPIGIHVPQWAYVGIGIVYASAFTELPRFCGVPYCPEKSHEIELIWRG